MLQTFFWNLASIGKVIVSAEDVPTARTQVMSLLSEDDGAREELAEALQAEPRNITGMRFTMVDFIEG